MPKWRKFTWFILIVNVLFLIWLITGVSSASGEIQDCSTLAAQAKSTCEAGNAGTAVGTGLGVGIIILLWVMVDIILGIIWLVTRSSGRPCPVCGTNVKQGVTVCPKCGHDFRAAAGGIPPAPA